MDSTPGFYHCSGSTIKILSHNICDQIHDCPLGDDEKLCDLHKTKCPHFCSCLQYSILCQGLVVDSNVTIMQQKYFQVSTGSNFDTLFRFLIFFEQIIYLNVSHSYFPDFCFSRGDFRFYQLLFLHATASKIQIIKQNCLAGTPNVIHLDFMNNEISQIKCLSFAKAVHISVLILLSNKLSELRRCHLSGLTALSYLDLRDNQIVLIDENLFTHFVKKELHLKYNNAIFCCLQEIQHCLESLSLSCSHLLPEKFKYVFWTAGFIGLVSTLACFTMNVHILRGHPSTERTSKAYVWQVTALSFASPDIFCVVTFTWFY